MTRDEFSLLFHKANLNLVAFRRVMDSYSELQRMVEMAVNQEREACAKICDELILAHPGYADLTAKRCAAAIRARNNGGCTRSNEEDV